MDLPAHFCLRRFFSTNSAVGSPTINTQSPVLSLPRRRFNFATMRRNSSGSNPIFSLLSYQLSSTRQQHDTHNRRWAIRLVAQWAQPRRDLPYDTRFLRSSVYSVCLVPLIGGKTLQRSMIIILYLSVDSAYSMMDCARV
jgi:hypothetical protein